MSQSNNTTVRVFHRGRSIVVGIVRGDTLYKTVSGSRHFKTTPAGIANDVSALNDAKKAGALYVEVTDRETALRYTATIALVFSKGKYFNDGFGDQINLLFPFWTVSGGNPGRNIPMRIDPGETVSPDPIQLGMF